MITLLYDVVRYYNCIKNFSLLTAISLKNDDSRFVTLSTMREINSTLFPVALWISIPIMSTNIISKFNVNYKKIFYTLRGCLGIYRPPAGDRVDLFPTRVEDPWHEEGIVRGLTFADLLRDVYLTMRVVHNTRNLGELPRGLRGGNSICSYKRV